MIDVDKVNYYPIDYIDLSETSSELALVVKRLKKVYSSTSRLAGFGSDLDLYVCIEGIINGRSISTGIGISNYAVDHCSDREIQAIYLHELKHVKNRDALFHIICSNIMPFLVPITSALIILIIIFGNPALIPFIVITLLSLPAVELANDIFAEADADLLPTSLGFGRELIATIGTYPSGKYTLRQKRILKLLNND